MCWIICFPRFVTMWLKLVGVMNCRIRNYREGYRSLHVSTFLTDYREKCFLKDKDIDKPEGATKLNNVESAALCQQNCQTNTGCQSFVYVSVPTTKECFLKSSKVEDAYLQPRNGLISGPKYCPMQYAQGDVYISQKLHYFLWQLYTYIL